ncbi:MAG: porin [Acidobacteria bacterium]|nr:porin [Acidobacteriota bacterium]MCW5970318.1 porin [Blastocatellales bacterium]
MLSTGTTRNPARFASGFLSVTLSMIVSAMFITAVSARAAAAQTTASAIARNNSDSETKKAPGKADGKVDAEELVRIVTALEERIRDLEAKLAVKTSSAAPISPNLAETINEQTVQIADLKKEVSTIQEDAKKNSGFVNFFREVEVSGLVDGYYSYNFNRPDGRVNTGRAFDTQDNSFSLNLAKFTLEKQNDLANPLGFKIDLGFGPTVDIVNGPNPTGGDAIRHMLQGYVSYVAPIGSGLTLDFGKFFTPAGAEVIETKDNYNYSRSYLFGLGPYYHTGLRAKYEINNKVSVSGFLVNGWDSLIDNNQGKTYGVSVGLAPTSRLAITQTYLGGPEQQDSSKEWRHFADTVVSYAASEKLSFLANFAYGSDQYIGEPRGHWKGLAAAFRYAFNSRLAFSPRFEVFDDPDGLRTGTAQTLKGLTFTQEVALAGNLVSRFEYRRDWSDADYFSKSTGRLVRGQNTLLVGFSYFISSRGQ